MKTVTHAATGKITPFQKSVVVTVTEIVEDEENENENDDVIFLEAAQVVGGPPVPSKPHNRNVQRRQKRRRLGGGTVTASSSSSSFYQEAFRFDCNESHNHYHIDTYCIDLDDDVDYVDHAIDPRDYDDHAEPLLLAEFPYPPRLQQSLPQQPPHLLQAPQSMKPLAAISSSNNNTHPHRIRQAEQQRRRRNIRIQRIQQHEQQNQKKLLLQPHQQQQNSAVDPQRNFVIIIDDDNDDDDDDSRCSAEDNDNDDGGGGGGDDDSDSVEEVCEMENSKVSDDVCDRAAQAVPEAAGVATAACECATTSPPIASTDNGTTVPLPNGFLQKPQHSGLGRHGRGRTSCQSNGSSQRQHKPRSERRPAASFTSSNRHHGCNSNANRNNNNHANHHHHHTYMYRFNEQRQYNYHFSTQEAEAYQERLFREAAERLMRDHASSSSRGGAGGVHREDDDNDDADAKDPRKNHDKDHHDHERIPYIAAPMRDIATQFPHHWTWYKSHPFACLGLPQASAAPLVRTQYRILAKRYHPDKSRSQDTIPQFLAISRAYRKIDNDPHEY